MIASPAYTYLSLGAGVQSSALLVMACLGLHACPRSDVAIFADTQAEPAYVYEHLARLEEFAARHGLEVARVTAGSIEADMIGGNTSGRPPLFVGGGGMLRRQCTGDYKIDPINREVRRRLGKIGRPMLPLRVRRLIGISLDETERMRDAQEAWAENVYPLVDARLRRYDCERIVVDAGLPRPRKSACVWCPYHSEATWTELRREHPAEFDRAVAFDARIRTLPLVRGELYVHRSRRPLSEAVVEDGQGDLFGNECEGICGV